MVFKLIYSEHLKTLCCNVLKIGYSGIPLNGIERSGFSLKEKVMNLTR
jgi:hypothetical protein